MRITIFFLTTILLVTAADAIDPGERNQVIDREQSAWQMYKDKKADQFRKILSDNYRAAYADGIYLADGEMSAMREMDLKSFSLSRVDVVSTDPNTQIVTYSATMQATRGGKDLSGNYNATSVWQKQGNDWKVVFHTNVPEQKPKA